MSARVEARDRKQKRADEEARRASVWGEQRQQETDEEGAGNKQTTANSPPRTRKTPPTAGATAGQPAPRASPSSSLFSAGAPDASSGRSKAAAVAASKGEAEPEAVTRIQAAFRGGKARWELDRRKEKFRRTKAEAAARAQEKVRTVSSTRRVLAST